jgi:hypothetical protein
MDLYTSGRAKFVEWTTGKSGTGLQFDGVDDYVSAGSSVSLNVTNPLTVEAWVKLDSYNSDTNVGQVIAGSYAGGVGYIFLLRGPGARLGLRLHPGSYQAIDADDLALNQWYHVVGTYDGATIRVYVNGAVKSSVNWTGVVASSSLIIGRASWYNGNFFNGTIDEVMIANRSLNATEVLAHYNAGKAKHADWDPNGKVGSAMKFDGVDDYVNFGSSLSLGITDFSISFWLKQGQANGDILNKYSAGSTGFRITSNSNALSFQANYNGIAYDISTTASALDNNWHHVVLTADRDTSVTWYVDGTPSGSPDTSNIDVNINSAAILCLGKASWASNNYNGSIDELRIWNRSLSATEIRQQYYSSLNKYAPVKWIFTATEQSVPAGTYDFFLTASGLNNTSDFTANRTVRVS